jgi:murein DD-endopeptidase MepM/ murein hydrolase activator NlpD
MRNKRFSNILPCKNITGVTLLSAVVLLSACDTTGDRFRNFDLDLRNNAGGLDTSSAARQATVNRPRPDSRGVISYPNYQVAVARRGDTVDAVASRIGVPADRLASFNGLRPSDKLNSGEIVALPRGTRAPSAAGTIQSPESGPRDITQIATSAIDSAQPAPEAKMTRTVPSRRIDGPEPVRHQVKAGETAFGIARLYNVSVRSLNDWNGLGPDLEVRAGQFLLIPIVDKAALPKAFKPEPAPGSGTKTVVPQPPSGSTPLPPPEPAAKPKVEPEPEPAAVSKLLAPVTGKVIRPYKRGKNEGIDIEASAGTSVKAAADGTVAAITRDTDQVPILVLRHAGNLLTVYANIGGISVKKGDKVKRGQVVAKVGSKSPSFLHFEVREGFDSTDPVPFLK